jgi:hypothetical protein
MKTHHKWIVTFLIVILLIMIFYQIWIIVDGANVVDSLSVAESNSFGFCTPSNNIYCEFSPNDALFSSFPSDVKVFSTSNALMLGDLIGRIESENFDSPPELELVNLLQPSNSSVFCGIWKRVQNSEKVLFIAFRGTKTEAEWEQDLRISQVSFGTIPNVMVHKGFVSVYQLFESALFNLIAEENPQLLLIGGHSLGAATATLFGFQLQFATPLSFGTYAFASPRVGNLEFASMVTFPLFRIANTNDLVNDIPLAVTPNFSGNHAPWLYQHTGTLYNFTRNWGSWKSNHLIPIYLNALNTCTLQVESFNICPNP